MKILGRMKAFTLLEMLVVLALSSIAVALVWLVYTNFTGYAMRMNARSQKIREVEMLDLAIRNEIISGAEIRSANHNLEFIHGDTSVTFQFIADSIISSRGDLAFKINHPEFRIDTSDYRKKLTILAGDSTDKAVYSYLVPYRAKARESRIN